MKTLQSDTEDHEKLAYSQMSSIEVSDGKIPSWCPLYFLLPSPDVRLLGTLGSAITATKCTCEYDLPLYP